MKTTTVDSRRLAREFARLIRRDYTPAQLAVVRSRNRELRLTDPHCCATHDFYDANMIMLEACANVSGVPESKHDFGDEALCAVVNEAWDLAKAAEFRDAPLRGASSSAPRALPCKLHKGAHAYTVCSECGHQYCNRHWAVACPRCHGRVRP
jgi:hypothetical protein